MILRLPYNITPLILAETEVYIQLQKKNIPNKPNLFCKFKSTTKKNYKVTRTYNHLIHEQEY